MKVLHISPTFFDDASVIGGAERYVWELTKAMTAFAEVSLVTFGPSRRRETRDGVAIEQLRRLPIIEHPLASNPVTWRFLRAIGRADVVHCHQVDTFPTAVGVLAARMMGKPVFVTDLGGGHMYAPTNYLPILRSVSGFLLISEYSRAMWQQAPRARQPERLDVIYGGVDTQHFAPGGTKDPNMVLYVGRLLPHKGIEHLIDALEAPMRLHVVGRPYDAPYFAMLQERARGKAVVFEHDVDDRGLVERYQRALVSVLPSVPTDWRGQTTAVAELFGLVVVEAMACGTPAIVSRTTSLPELVEDGRTGWIVPPADAMALRERLRLVHADPALAASMGAAARAHVMAQFTWRATAERCLSAYRIALAAKGRGAL
jgi:glycosyltransferase involved in cell wall biosynthesis